MDYGRITPVLVAALQEAHKKIKALKNVSQNWRQNNGGFFRAIRCNTRHKCY
jgi:ribosomal protein L17